MHASISDPSLNPAANSDPSSAPTGESHQSWAPAHRIPTVSLHRERRSGSEPASKAAVLLSSPSPSLVQQQLQEAPTSRDSSESGPEPETGSQPPLNLSSVAASPVSVPVSPMSVAASPEPVSPVDLHGDDDDMVLRRIREADPHSTQAYREQASKLLFRPYGASSIEVASAGQPSAVFHLVVSARR